MMSDPLQSKEAWIMAVAYIFLIGLAWGMIEIKTEDLNYETEKQWTDIERIYERYVELSDRLSRLEGRLEGQ